MVKAVPEGQRADRSPRHAAAGPDHAGTGGHRRSGARGLSSSTSGEPAWYAMELVAGESLEPVLDDPAVEPGAGGGPDAARRRGTATTARRRSGHRARCRRSAAHPGRRAGAVGTHPGRRPHRAGRRRRQTPAICSRGRRPEPRRPTLVHGDYRLGNIICRGAEPAALIDWEIWSAGDPRVELGWFLVFADGDQLPRRRAARCPVCRPRTSSWACYAGGGPALTDHGLVQRARPPQDGRDHGPQPAPPPRGPTPRPGPGTAARHHRPAHRDRTALDSLG